MLEQIIERLKEEIEVCLPAKMPPYHRCLTLCICRIDSSRRMGGMRASRLSSSKELLWDRKYPTCFLTAYFYEKANENVGTCVCVYCVSIFQAYFCSACLTRRVIVVPLFVWTGK